MALNIYVMPIALGTSPMGGAVRQPKYLSTFSSFNWGMFDYGNEPQCLVGVTDIGATANSSLIANTDVFAAPPDLDTTIGGGATLSKLQSGLEADNLPGTWIVSTTTWRQAIRFVGGCCQYMQRYQGLALPVVFQTGVTLDTTFGSLPAATQQGMLTAAQTFGFSTGAFVSGATLRTVISSAANQYLATGLPLTLASVAI